jgi:hypothetical protein
MNDSSLEMELEHTILTCIEPCSEYDYLLTLLLTFLFVGYLIWEWNHE